MVFDYLLGGIKAAHSMYATSGWGGGGTDIYPGVGGGIGGDFCYWSCEQLGDVLAAPINISSYKIGIPFL